MSAQEKAPTLPPIRFVHLDEIQPELRAQRGKAILLNFWAIWCSPCVAELPHLIEIADEFRDKGGIVLSISYDLMLPDKTRQNVLPKMQEFVALKKLNFPVLILDEDDENGINELYDLPGGIPVTLAFDATGKLVDRVDERANKDRFVEMMEKALGATK